MAPYRAGYARSFCYRVIEKIEVHIDGMGEVAATWGVVPNRDRIARFTDGVFRKKRRDCEMHPYLVNDVPVVVFTSSGAVDQVASSRIEGEVRAVYMTGNPDKLTRWAAAEVE